MCCSVGAVGHLCAIFNSVSKSEAELNMVFVIRCGAGGSGNGVQAVGVGARASACALASNISFRYNGMMGHRPCNFILLDAKAIVFGSNVMAMLFPPFLTGTG